MVARASQKKVRGAALPPDPDESAALAKAVEALNDGHDTAESAAVAAISAWVQERARRCAGARLADNLVFDLGDAQMRGFVEAALPTIADAAGGAIDLGQAVVDMSTDDVITLFVAAIHATNDAAVAAGESQAFPFSDRVPF